MTHNNPYSPSAAAVGDVTCVRLLAERPRQVVHAVTLLCVSLAVGMLADVVDSAADPYAWVIGVPLGIVMAVSIWRGRSWGRALYGGLVVVSSFAIPWIVEEMTPLETTLNALTLPIDVIAVYFLFTKPGALWFHYGRVQRVP